jgi:hypothetical protein
MKPDQRSILEDARRRAAVLLEDLLRHRAEVGATGPATGLESVRAGAKALREAVDSAARLLQSIDQALASHTEEPNHDR